MSGLMAKTTNIRGQYPLYGSHTFFVVFPPLWDKVNTLILDSEFFEDS